MRPIAARTLAGVLLLLVAGACVTTVGAKKRGPPRNPLHAHLHHGTGYQKNHVSGNIHGHAYHHHGHDPENERKCPSPVDAAIHGKLDTITEAIECGVDVDERNRGGDTALIIAAMAGNAPMVEALLKAGANPDARNNGGHTAIMRAAQNGQARTSKLLIEAGADLHAKDNGGDDVLYHAHIGHHEEVVRLLQGAIDVADAAAKSAQQRATEL